MSGILFFIFASCEPVSQYLKQYMRETSSHSLECPKNNERQAELSW